MDNKNSSCSVSIYKCLINCISHFGSAFCLFELSFNSELTENFQYRPINRESWNMLFISPSNSKLLLFSPACCTQLKKSENILALIVKIFNYMTKWISKSIYCGKHLLSYSKILFESFGWDNMPVNWSFSTYVDIKWHSIWMLTQFQRIANRITHFPPNAVLGGK